MAHNAIEIAKWFVNRAHADADQNGGEYMTNLKLQKMLYFAQGTYGAIKDNKLFNEEILHWQHGPVVKEVYSFIKNLPVGDDPSYSIKDKFEGINFEQQVTAVLEEVYNVYGEYSAWGLRNLSHTHKPWIDTNNHDVIPYESIVDYFKREVVID